MIKIRNYENGEGVQERMERNSRLGGILLRISGNLLQIIFTFYSLPGCLFGGVVVQVLFPTTGIAVWLEDLFDESELSFVILTVGVPLLILNILGLLSRRLGENSSWSYLVFTGMFWGLIGGYVILGMFAVPLFLRAVTSAPLIGPFGIWLQGIYDASVFQYYLFTVGVPIAVVVVLMLIRVWFGGGIAEWSGTNFGRESRQ